MSETKSTKQKRRTTRSEAVNTTSRITQTTKQEAVKETTSPKHKELDPHMFVTVKNGYQGSLIYKSKKTGEKFEWESFGDEQDIELAELKSAKNSNKAFFENNWFLIDDPDVLDYLGVVRYYKDALSYEDFTNLFDLTPEEIEKRISKLSKGQKHSLTIRVSKLISDGEIDSNKVIHTLEKCLSIDLSDR